MVSKNAEKMIILFILLLFTVGCGHIPEQTVPETSSASVPETTIPDNTSDYIEKIWQQNTFKAAAESYIPLDKNNLDEWNSYFQSDLAGHFLLSDYKQAEDIDLALLLEDAPFVYADPVRGDMTLNTEELSLLEERFPVWKNRMPEEDLFKISVKELDQLLEEYTGLTLSETNMRGFRFSFLEETQTFYWFLAETRYSDYSIIEGVKVNENSILLHWKRTRGEHSLVGKEGMVLLERTTDGWKFVMNKELMP